VRARPLHSDVDGGAFSRGSLECPGDWMLFRRGIVRLHFSCAVSASLVCSGRVRRVLAVVRAVSLRDAGCTETAPVRMDATAFKLLERKRRFKRQTLEIAKRRILRREAASALASAYGVNLQRIYTIETQVTAAWQELHLPAGWSEITLVAPKALIAEFKSRSRAARKKLLRKTQRRIQSAGRAKAR
jgi:TrfB plasmid transcriptional repressor